MSHTHFIHRCLEVAAAGRKFVGNGVMVGAVLVRDGKVIAEGYHIKYGDLHAERHVLQNFKGEIKPDDILYTNLEPCCHTGKQPPCTDIIIERGVKHVVFGMRDPDHRVLGKGIEILQKAGVEVIGPVESAQCEWFNRGFVSVRTKGRPWITLKQAKNSDQLTANSDGSRLMITSQEQDIWSHTFLRAKHDAILVGVQTIINDNPILDARLSGTDYHPWRIILDPHGRIPLDATVLTDHNASSTIVITSDEKFVKSIEKTGALALVVQMKGDSFEWNDLWKVLLTPQEKFKGLTSILVEGGEKTWDVFKQSGFVDEEVSLVGRES